MSENRKQILAAVVFFGMFVIDWLDKTYINPVILYKTQEDDYICKHQPDQCWIKLKGKSK